MLKIPHNRRIKALGLATDALLIKCRCNNSAHY